LTLVSLNAKVPIFEHPARCSLVSCRETRRSALKSALAMKPNQTSPDIAILL
jgi:hypothetical protein